jgi:hypothetical protein
MTFYLHKAAVELGYDISFTIEQDGKMWHGTDDNRIYLTTQQKQAVETKALEIKTAKITARTALLAKLGITEAEAQLLLG